MKSALKLHGFVDKVDNTAVISLIDFQMSNAVFFPLPANDENHNHNQNRFIRSYYRPRRPPLRPIWSLSQRPPGKKYIHECMYVKVKLVNTSKS